MCGWRTYTYYTTGGFLLKAKAIWEHTGIAGGLLVFFVPFFGSTKNSTSKTGPCPNKEKLERAVSALPSQYTLSMIDERLYHLCKTETWSSDLVSQFSDYEQYRQLGIGAVIYKDNLIISGASSYSRYRDGIEIEIDTKEEYRRKGLAYICAAKLILECLKHNLYPSWDAHNLASISLAQKLGYRYSHTYTAVEIWGY